MEIADDEIIAQLNAMLQGGEITTLVDTNVIYPEIKDNPSSIYSFLLVAGYLKLAKSEMSPSGNFICKVALPNREIAYVYRKEVIGKISKNIPQSVSVGIQEALYLGDVAGLQKKLRRFLLESVSNFDLVNENSYHMMLIGLCAIMCDKYYLTSNREAGAGRFDIQLMPKDSSDPGIVMELKHQKNASDEVLRSLSNTALEQINKKLYDSEMKAHGIWKVLKYGVAFSGKNVEIAAGC